MAPPLQYSCLENPMDGGAWWAAVYGVAQSPTRLKRLSSSSSTVFHKGKQSRADVVLEGVRAQLPLSCRMCTVQNDSLPSAFQPAEIGHWARGGQVPSF